MKKRAFIISITLLSLIIGCSDKTSKPLVQNDKIELNTINNETITFKKTEDGFKYLSDKTLLLTFFNTSCVPCKAQIPHLNNLQNRYQNELSVVSIMLGDESMEDVKSFVDKTNANFTVTLDKNNFKLSATLGNITSVPYMVIYDKDGQYVTHYVGAAPEEMIEADLKRVF